MSTPPPPVPPKPGKNKPSHAPNTHERRQAWTSFLAAALHRLHVDAAVDAANTALSEFDRKWGGR